MKVLNFKYANLYYEGIFTMAITLMLMLGTVYTSIGGLAFAQAGTTSGNVTAQIAPQGTSLTANSSKGNLTMER
jgi:hypothetical protein